MGIEARQRHLDYIHEKQRKENQTRWMPSSKDVQDYIHNNAESSLSNALMNNVIFRRLAGR